MIERPSLTGVNFALKTVDTQRKKKKRNHERILLFITTYYPGVKTLKQILMENWSLIQNQPLLRTIYKNLRSFHTGEVNP